jgi:acetate kinase
MGNCSSSSRESARDLSLFLCRNNLDLVCGESLDVFAVSVRKTIGAYMALLGGVDVLVFTGGIGEHSDRVRSAATNGLELLGLLCSSRKRGPMTYGCWRSTR